MNEVIKSIEEGTFVVDGEFAFQRGRDGYIITTDKQVIKIGISNDQHCCENWGYVSSEDDFSQFVGALLRNVVIVSDKLETMDFELGKYEGAAMFVNLETSAGTLQFVMYNEHNGYYSHDAVLITRDGVTEETL